VSSAGGKPVQAGKHLVHRSEAFGSDREPAMWDENDHAWHTVSASEDAPEGTRAFADPTGRVAADHDVLGPVLPEQFAVGGD
jgi:hypothetical protein